MIGSLTMRVRTSSATGRERPRFARWWAVIPAALLTIGAPVEASATGMQGHMYMAQCAAEQAKDARLRALFDAHSLHLENGAIFPDSGYTAKDHDQGEIAHWEQYIEGYIQVLRARYASPLDDPEGAAQAAFLMGAAAHGITDSTFDSLFYARADQVEPGDTSSLDMAMDIFLVHDLPRYYVPEPVFDAKLLSLIYGEKIAHPVSPEAIEEAMSTARSGVAVVTKLLHTSADGHGKEFPWSRAHLLDPRTPGGYPFGARVTLGYYREILRRLDGDPSADQVVIGTYPDSDHPLVTLDGSRPDGRVNFFFGEGIDRASLGEGAVVVRDGAGVAVPAKVDVFRGDKWANVLTVEVASGWAPNTKYSVTLAKSIKTLSGASPTADHLLSFTTCAPAAGGDCAESAGPPPPSPCPILDAKYVSPPSEPEEPEEPDPPEPMSPPVDTTPKESGGCAFMSPLPGAGSVGGWASFVLALACGALALRRRAR